MKEILNFCTKRMFAVIIPLKSKQRFFCHKEIFPKDTNGMANNVDVDQSKNFR